MKYFFSFLLIALIVLLLSFASWRWFYLGIKNVDTRQISTISQSIEVNPIDELLKKYLPRIAKKPTLIEQFKRQSREINLNNLWVDSCEVTQGQFARFANWQAFHNTSLTIDVEQPKSWNYLSQTAKHKILGKLVTPVSGVSFFDGFSYCQAANGRLPNSDEFEAISRSKKQWLYPWGNQVIKQPWRYYDPILNISESCGVYQNAKTDNGIYDLSNNVSEWTIDKNKAVLMGGNGYQRPAALYALSLIKRDAPKDFRSQWTGFRCVYDMPTKNNTQTISAADLTKKHQLPWKGSSTLIAVRPGSYTIGMPKNSKIAKLLRAMDKADLNDYKNNTAILTQLANQTHAQNFSMMRFEVSVSQYRHFLADPLVYIGFYNHKKQPEHIRLTPNNWQAQQQNLNHPIVGISWWNAWAFANWIGGRLPSIEEWQGVANNGFSLFPYGNYYQSGRAVDRLYNKNPANRPTQPLSIYASNDGSKQHILGLSGNVAEWTNTTVLKGNSFLVVIKGGSYLMPKLGGQVGQSGEAPPDYKSSDVGFRVVFSNNE